MAYQSKYTGLQIDDIFDSVEWKQGKIEDLASIRAGAQKGATALQSYTEKYTGTVTGIKINGIVKSGSGIIDLGTIESKTLTESDIATMGFTKNTGTVTGVKINGATKNPSSGVVDLGTVITDVSNLATKDEAILKEVIGELVTAQAQALYGGGIVYALPDQANGDEDDILLSHNSVKTINGESILGSGDLTIEAEEIYEVDVPYYESSDIIGITTEMWNKLLVTPTISAKFSNTPFKSTLNKTDLGMGNLLFYIGSSINFSNGAPLVVTVIFSGEGENFVGIPPNSCASTYSSLPISTSQLENDSNFISSDNLKSINGQSLVGSGDIEISGGSGGGGKEYVEAPLFTEPLGASIMFTPSVPLEPNKVYVAKKKVSSINAEIMLWPSDSIGAEYTIMFQAFTSELPITVYSYASLLWANGAIPTIEADTYYELSLVLNNINNTDIIKAVLTPFKPVE